MARNPSNYLPINTDPLGDYESRLHNLVGGNPNFFRYGRFGLLTDNSTLKGRVEGSAPHLPGNTYGTASKAPTNFSGGSTPSDPGGYNWNTFTNNVQRVTNIVDEAVKYRMQNRRLAKAKSLKDSEESMNTTINAYKNAWNPSHNLGVAYQNAYNAAFPPTPDMPPPPSVPPPPGPMPFPPPSPPSKRKTTLSPPKLTDVRQPNTFAPPVVYGEPSTTRTPAARKPKATRRNAPPISSPRPLGA